jgi:hypothetical protein
MKVEKTGAIFSPYLPVCQSVGTKWQNAALICIKFAIGEFCYNMLTHSIFASYLIQMADTAWKPTFAQGVRKLTLSVTCYEPKVIASI